MLAVSEHAAAEPADLTIAEAAAALSSGRLSVRDLLSSHRARIAELNGRFQAFSHLAAIPDGTIDALQAELTAGRARSPLHGITIGIKGSIPVAALPWTEGSAMFADRVATADADIVSRARAAGALVLGVTTLSELAMYGVRNPFEPMGLNPWDPERTAGGSSTGAGVAGCLGMASVNIGTDAGGSIRNPACHLGMVGFMASAGSLPDGGIPMHVPSFPALGLIARSVADVVTAYETLGTQSSNGAPPTQRLLVPRHLIERMCDDKTLTLFAAALERLRDHSFTLIDQDIATWADAERAAGLISLYESARSLSHMDCGKASDGIRNRRDTGLRIEDSTYDAARRCVEKFARDLAYTLDAADADAFVSPTWPFAAPPIDAETVPIRGPQMPVDPHRNCFVRAANAAGASALTLPMGVYPQAGVPAGLHLMTARGRDSRLLALAATIEPLMPPLPFPFIDDHDRKK